MSRRTGVWAVLGIDPTDDVKAVRKAYADKLKAMDIDREAAQYAALRNARDTALHLAKARHAAPTVEPPDEEWGIGALEGGDAGEGEGEAVAIAAPAAGPAVGTGEPPSPAAPEERALPADARLYHLLFPGDEVSEVPFSDEEEEQARCTMRELIAEMMAGELSRQHAGEYWLADRLATGWPRSAPLLAEASEAFDWEKERGQLGEGRAQAFLSARLRGLRFYDAVREPGHWANRAWRELSRPGAKGPFARFRANKTDVLRLLTGIRQNFPEIESYLDSDRVASWEHALENPWKVSGGLVFAIFLGLQALRFCSVPAPESHLDVPPAIEASHVWSNEELNGLAQELFGPGMTYAHMIELQPELDTQFVLKSSLGNTPHPQVTSDLIAYVRTVALRQERADDFEQFVRIKQLKLHLMNFAVASGGTAQCVELMDSLRLFDGAKLPPELRTEERALAAQLLEKHQLKWPELTYDAPTKASIPHTMFAAAEKAAGISDEAARQAAMDTGDSGNRCRFRKALLAEVLRRPGTVNADALKLL